MQSGLATETETETTTSSAAAAVEAAGVGSRRAEKASVQKRRKSERRRGGDATDDCETTGAHLLPRGYQPYLKCAPIELTDMPSIRCSLNIEQFLCQSTVLYIIKWNHRFRRPALGASAALLAALSTVCARSQHF